MSIEIQSPGSDLPLLGNIGRVTLTGYDVMERESGFLYSVAATIESRIFSVGARTEEEAMFAVAGYLRDQAVPESEIDKVVRNELPKITLHGEGVYR